MPRRSRGTKSYPRERMPSPNRMMRAGTGLIVGATGLMVGVGALGIASATMRDLHP